MVVILVFLKTHKYKDNCKFYFNVFHVITFCSNNIIKKWIGDVCKSMYFNKCRLFK